tara:strand:- start:465 stop:1007 length:543 start_codon:yes stop_codon:yes gene_type:complete
MEFPENSYSVDDYITLNARDRQSVNGNVLTWAIPQTYYTNRRSQVCTVEVVSGCVAENSVNGSVDMVIISYENGAQNSYSSSNASPVIGIAGQSVRGSNVNDETFSIAAAGQLLTQARPNRISLRVESSRRASLGNGTTPAFALVPNDANDCQFVICLKFKYYNQLKTASNLEDQFDMPL